MIAVTWRMITASPDFSAQIGAAEMPDRPTLPQGIPASSSKGPRISNAGIATLSFDPRASLRSGAPF
jgi:hypothetical protein